MLRDKIEELIEDNTDIGKWSHFEDHKEIADRIIELFIQHITGEE